MKAKTNVAVALATPLIAQPRYSVHADGCADCTEMLQMSSSADIKALNGDMSDSYVQSQVEYLISQIVQNKDDALIYDGVSYEYSDLYDMSAKQKVGYVIDFSYSDAFGYMIVQVDETSIELSELAMEQRSPYYGKNGKYLYSSIGGYYFIPNDAQPNAQPQMIRVKMKIKGEVKDPVTFEYECSSWELFDKYALYDCDSDYSTDYSTRSNNCANVAGVIALNYWNRYYNNTLLYLKKEEMRNINSYSEKSMSIDTARKYMNIFYEYMNTNWLFGTWGGTRPEDGYKGFERLIKEKGFRTERHIVSTYKQIKLFIGFDIPVFITSKDYVYGYMEAENGKQVFYGNRTYGYENAHTFIAYGYSEYKIYDRNGKLSTIELLTMADGWGGSSNLHIAESEIMSAAAIDVFRISISRC